jgi:hypothetical protein
VKAIVTRVDGVDYHYIQRQGYINRGSVKRLVENGWEVVNYTPVIVGGFTLRQGIYTLRRPVPES